jgi:cephalosporin-C deacetylase
MKNLVGAFGLLLGLTFISAPAMETNLATPFDSKPSPPADSRLVFYSSQPSGDKMIFSGEKEIIINVRAGTRCIGLSYKVCRNVFLAPFIIGDAEPLPPDSFVIKVPTDKLKPGFFDIDVLLSSGDNKPIPGVCTFGWEVDKMPITLDRPADFLSFWNKGKEALAKVALDPKLGEFQTFDAKAINAYNLASACLPDDYDPKGHRSETVESAKIDFAGMGGVRIHGWLAKPPGNGPFPAMLILPGAGFAARPRPLEHARHGFLAMDIEIHGQEVDLPDKYPTLPGYYDNIVFTPTEGYYYYNVYLNCMQAINYLESRPDVDKTRIVVVGGSQGGRMSVMLAGLDHRLAAAVPAIAHFCNQPYLKWSEASNKATPPQTGMDRDAPPPLPDTPEGHTLGYYDPMSFAPDIKCPLMMNAGLIDRISSPYGTFAAFAQAGTKDKTIVPLPGMAHDWSCEFDRRAWRWLDQKLKLPPPPAPAVPPK